MHLSEADLAALAHDEMNRASGDTTAHLDSCAECSAKLSAMRRSDREVAELLGQLDHAAPAIRSSELFLAARARSRRVGTIAAGLVLAAAAAAAAVPSSPLHKLLVRAVGGVRGESAVAGTPLEPPRPEQRAGIAFIPGGSLDVHFRNAESGGQVRISLVDGDQVSVVATGDAGFSLQQSQLQIDPKGKEMSFILEIPRTLRDLQVDVGDRVVFQRRAGIVTRSTAPEPNAPYVFELGRADDVSHPVPRR